jgi:predicted acylesterase/phospholipase RssA
MFEDEAWLHTVKKSVRTIVRSLSAEGLLALPVAIAQDVDAATQVETALSHAQAIFNLNPIEGLIRANVDPARISQSGITLPMIAVSLETGRRVTIDENESVDAEGPAPVLPIGVPRGPVSNAVIEGAMASASIPGIFPPRQLGAHMCVDGGVRDVVPVREAVSRLGCFEVYAIRVSAPVAPQPMEPARGLFNIIGRGVLETTYDEVADDDTNPYLGWGPGVKVLTIRPTFDMHDLMVVDPGLIRIAIDYGRMRAGDMIDVPDDPPDHKRNLAIYRL